MIIWSGWGGMALLPILLLPLVGFAFQGLGLDEDRGWALGIVVAGAVGAGFVYWLDRWREQRHPQRELVDPSTGERYAVRRRDSVFFIPLRYLWLPYVAYSVVGLVRLFTL